MKKFIKIFKILTFVLLFTATIGFIETSCDKKDQTASAYSYNLSIQTYDYSNYNFSDYLIYSNVALSGIGYNFHVSRFYFSNCTINFNLYNFSNSCQIAILCFVFGTTSPDVLLFDYIYNFNKPIYIPSKYDYFEVQFRNSFNDDMVGVEFRYDGYIFEGDVTQSDFLAGYKAGYKKGNEDGYAAGEQSGYTNGYAAGVSDTVDNFSPVTASSENVTPLNGSFRLPSDTGGDRTTFNSDIVFDDSRQTFTTNRSAAYGLFGYYLNTPLDTGNYTITFNYIGYANFNISDDEYIMLNVGILDTVTNNITSVAPLAMTSQGSQYNANFEIDKYYDAHIENANQRVVVYYESNNTTLNSSFLTTRMRVSGRSNRESYDLGFADGSAVSNQLAFNNGYNAGYDAGSMSNLNGEGILQAVYYYTRLLFELSTKFVSTKIAGDITIGVLIFGPMAAAMIINLVVGLVKKFLGGRGATDEV